MHIRKELEKNTIKDAYTFLIDTLKKHIVLIRTIGTVATIIRVVQMFKGEFTHFDEIFPIIDRLAKHGVNIGMIVSDEERFKYIHDTIEKKSSKANSKHKKTEVIRYYVFPQEYILILTGELMRSGDKPVEKGQFLIFWGKTKSPKKGAGALANLDWNEAKVAISE